MLWFCGGTWFALLFYCYDCYCGGFAIDFGRFLLLRCLALIPRCFAFDACVLLFDEFGV